MSHPKNTVKRDTLKELECKAQKFWAECRIFETDAGEEGEAKFMVTFPYPYMNGRLHLGHSFSLSKAEFAAGFERTQGKKVLFPFGFHVTGMPIKASADKVKKEIAQFGNPPVFPVETEAPATSAGSAKHSKVAAKTGTVKYQCQIMEALGIPLEEVYRFADPLHWIEYFPPLAKMDLDALGIHIDWRRSFVTTDINPYYDAFVRWQFNKLRRLGKIDFGKRHTIFSPLDGQPCLDHDRYSGEGVDAKEYTAIKLEVREGLAQVPGRRVFLLAATLRPETMYGQTNCWVAPDIEYGLFCSPDGGNDVYVCTERAARNLAYQDVFGPEQGKHQCLGHVKGSDLIGLAVIAPLSVYGEVYVLPMLSITASKGTGIVTSVPSNSPDDYAALRDLVEKEPMRKKYGLDDNKVLPFKAIPIIETPGLGNMSAEKLVMDLKIRSQNDRDALEKAKATAYKEDFYAGVMLMGPHAGKPVAVAKGLVRDEMVANGQALPYFEPESTVISRSGDECVVALTDQWYINYGEPSWRAEAERCVAQMELYSPEVRNQFEATLAWMRQWACSRSFGLGTRIPWDPKYLVESLSDSTIYMAFYTVVHLLQAEGVYNGSKPSHGILPQQMTDEVWEYVFGEDDAPFPAGSGIASDLLLRMRREFRFFYPLDLRVSGKDLVPNHLTMSIYNHVALFPERFWPRSFRANGHLLLNSEKMSKSTGNFMTIFEAASEFGADATRLALADAGDSVEDANFLKDTANMAILRLYNLKEFSQEVIAGTKANAYRHGEFNYADRVFDAEMSKAIADSAAAYKQMLYRDVVKVAFFELQNARDRYRDMTMVHGSAGMHDKVLRRFVELQARLMVPIIPHFAEHVWRDILGHTNTSILNEPFPAVEDYDESYISSALYVHDLARQMRVTIQGADAKKPKKGSGTEDSASLATKAKADLFIAKTFPKWQEEVVGLLRTHYDAESKTMRITDDKIVAALKPIMASVKDKAVLKKFIPFVMELKEKLLAEGERALHRTLPFDESSVLAANIDYLTLSLGLMSLKIHDDRAGEPDDEAQKRFDSALPGCPSIRISQS